MVCGGNGYFKFGQKPAQCALEGSIAITGALVQWIRDNLGLIEKSSDIETLARTGKNNGGVYLRSIRLRTDRLALAARSPASRDTPTKDTSLGPFSKRRHTRLAKSSRPCRDSKIKLDVLRSDDDDLLMQFQADILNRNVVRPLIKETTALGSAYAAGLAVGFYKDFEELRANWGVDHTWKP